MPRTEIQTLALVVDRWPYRDSDWVVLVLTSSIGMVTALARGARGSRRRFAGSLEHFVLTRLRLRTPRSEGMHEVLEGEVQRAFPGLYEELTRLETGQAMLALVRDLLREAPVTEEVFHRVLEAISHLENAPGDTMHGILWRMALGLVGSLGHPPLEERCPGCGRKATAWRDAALGPDGVMRCGECAAGTSFRFPVRALDPESGSTPGNRCETERMLCLWVSGILGRPWSLSMASGIR